MHVFYRQCGCSCKGKAVLQTYIHPFSIRPTGCRTWEVCHHQRLRSSDFAILVQVVVVLKKEVMKTQSKELEKAAEYRQLLVQAIHSCAVKFPDVAGNVIHLLMGAQPSLCISLPFCLSKRDCVHCLL